VAVDQLGEHFLAGTAFPAEHNGRVRRCDAAGESYSLAKGVGGPEADDEITVSMLAKMSSRRHAGVAASSDRVNSATDQHIEMRGAERLEDVVPCADAQSFEVGFHTRVAGHDDDERVLVRCEYRAKEIHSRNLRHVQVEHDKVEAASVHQLERFRSTANGSDVVTFDLEIAGTAFSEAAVIVYDEDTDARFGNWKQTLRQVCRT
jgi:hypothetical protein